MIYLLRFSQSFICLIDDKPNTLQMVITSFSLSLFFYREKNVTWLDHFAKERKFPGNAQNLSAKYLKTKSCQRKKDQNMPAV